MMNHYLTKFKIFILELSEVCLKLLKKIHITLLQFYFNLFGIKACKCFNLSNLVISIIILNLFYQENGKKV